MKANAIIIFQNVSVDLDNVYGNILPMHIEIFPVNFQYDHHPVNRKHLFVKKNKEKKKIHQLFVIIIKQ